MERYINLHCHTQYSPMDGYSTIPEYMARCKEIGMSTLAVTDHGTPASWREFQRETKEAGIKPILGIEAYFSPTDRFDKRAKANREEADSIYNHMIVIAKNDNGLVNLNAANRIAFNEGFYMKPRWDFELLQEHSEDLIITSGCLNGVIAKAIARGDFEGGVEWAKKFKDVFNDDFYMELQSHNPDEINVGLLTIADNLGIKSIITDDCHHASPKDKVMQEVFLILSTHPKIDRSAKLAEAQKMDLMERFDYLYPDRKMTFKDFDLYLSSFEEKQEEMRSKGFNRDDLYDNTIEVANKISKYTYKENLKTLPNIVPNPNEVIRINTFNGLKKLGLDKDPKYVARIERELGVILEKDFSTYFLVLEDALAWAHKQGIRIGRGRGSSAGSLVCYALGITNVDPLEYDLLFERFLDPERADWPDVDIDLQDSRREEVKQYLIDKYQHVASITNINTNQGKKAIKDAARVLGVPYAEVNKAMKVLNGISEVTGHDVLAEFKKNAISFNKKYPDVLKIAEKLRGRIYGYGIHAAGVVVADKPLSEYSSIETRKPLGADERIEVVGIDKDECESLGLIKIDLLGLNTLSVVTDTVKLIKENKGILVDPDEIPLDDPKVYEMLSNGNTLGVFQAEQSAYTKLLIKMGCSDFNDLTISNALVRPGAWNAIGEDYIAAKKGFKKPQKIHPDVDGYMADTFGYPVYQEQMMKLSIDLAGFTVGEANKLRKGIGKKKRDIVDSFKPQFIEGAKKKITAAMAEKLWKSFEEAGAYAFVKSHAVAYSMLSVQTAWLKVHYPTEFMCALLQNEKPGENSKITDYLLECKSRGIKILLPHVNKSQPSWSIEGESLRMGLAGVKFISNTLADRIIAERPYVDYADFKEYVLRKGSGLNTRVLSSLNYFGGASFPDNPVREDFRDYLYEYLGIPAFDNKLITERMREQLRPLEEYSDDETFLCMGMVKAVKRGEGWARVDMLDSTGSAGAFTEQDTEIVKGQMYLFLIGNNRIIKYILLDGESDASEDVIIDFLRRPVLNEIVPGQYKILAAQKRKTKNGGNMAYLVVGDSDKNLKTLLVFNNEFDKVRAMCKLGSVRAIETTKMKNGSECIRSVS